MPWTPEDLMSMLIPGTTATFSLFVLTQFVGAQRTSPQDPEVETGPALPLVAVTKTPKIPFLPGYAESTFTQHLTSPGLALSSLFFPYLV